MSTKYNILVSKDNVKNHLKGWKKTYATVADILSQSGFNWDSGNKMITVDDENVWNEYAKTHNDASKYRYKTIVNWDDIVDLCAKDRATGLGAEHADDVSDDMSIEEDNSSVSGTEGFHDDTLKRKTTSTSTLSSKPKKVKVEDTIAIAVSEMASSIKEMASTIVLAASTKATMTVDEVYEEVITIPDLDEDVRWKAIELFANNATKFQVLKKIPLEKKNDFVMKSMPRDI